MAFRIVARLLPLVIVVAGICGCGMNPQQQRFQNAFLPPPPHNTAIELAAADPPLVAPVPYLSDVPNLVSGAAQLSALVSRSDQLIEKARQHYQEGKKYYQSNEPARARSEFDQAVDLMVEASDNPSNRQLYESKLDEMVDTIHRLDLAGLGSAARVEEPQYEKVPLEDILHMTFPVDPKLKTKVRDEVEATVSELPLTVNDAVLGYIHYFSGRGRNTMIAGLRRAGRYRQLIQRILDEEGLPEELIHLAQAESGFLPRARSRKAAVGMWQFVAWRGRQYGLEQSRYSDDRLDPERATRAAARHLRDLYQKFGDWYLAIAAYDCGPGVIESAVERTGYADFFELRDRHVLPQETTNYVPIILAMTIMSKNAAEYGLDSVIADPTLEYDTIEVSSPTNLALVSDLTNTALSELQALNPALLRGLAPAGYSLHLPKGTGGYLMASLQTVPAERRASCRMHTVEGGETLATIGKRYRTAPGVIAAANSIQSLTPAVGDRLLIPAAYHESAVETTAAKPAHRAAIKGRKTAAHRQRRFAARSKVRQKTAFLETSGKLARAQQ